MTRQTRRLLFGLLACVASPCVAVAQNPQPAPPQETHTPVAPPSASQPPPEKIAPPDRTAGTLGHANLSDKLSRQQGMLQPPAVDPGIRVPAPRSQGTMPVIPPPGTAGGDEKVEPK
ncbi:MAG: hypothetical protein WA864_13130 [Acetobacteraceae bacterium]